jgi:hypothetical protein
MNSLHGVKSWKVDLSSRPATLRVDSDNASAEDIINPDYAIGFF